MLSQNLVSPDNAYCKSLISRGFLYNSTPLVNEVFNPFDVRGHPGVDIGA